MRSALLVSPVFLVVLLLVALSGCEQQKPVVLAFGSDWCSQCHADKPALRALGVFVRQVDVDEYPQLAREYDVPGLPTYVVVRGRTEVYRTHSMKQLKEFLR